jgi:dihydroorotase
MDRVIEGKAYVNGSFQHCCIGIKDGKIQQIKKILRSDEHINFGNNLIIPAGIDLHVHFRDPGYTHKEDFKTGSISAAFGGMSCVFDMPNTHPPTITKNSLIDKIQIAENKCYVDFGIFSGVTDNNIENLSKLAKLCCGFKIFLGNTTDAFQLNKNNLKNALYKIKKTNLIALIHAEDELCLKKYKINVKNLKDHLNSRPAECEESSIKSILQINKDISSKIHICHISSNEGLNSLNKSPDNISVGVTPHHLIFEITNNNLNQTIYKVNPPIRTHFDRESLWNGIINGSIDVLESDHAPHTLDEKDQEFNNAPSGIPGVETLFPLFLAAVKKSNIEFNRLISLICEKPADILDIPKGRIELGKDADLIVIDYKNMSTIKSDNLHYKCRWSPFEGMNAIFPSFVFIRGSEIIENHELVGSQGFGCNIKEKIS